MAEAKPKVVYRNPTTSPYIAERFNCIAERGNVDFEAWFNQPLEPGRSWDVRPDEWTFRHRYLGPARSKLILDPVRQIREARPDVLVTLYENPSFLAGIAAARSVGAKVIIHVMKVFDSWRPRRPSRELAKRLLFPRVDVIQVPGRDAARYARQYGARNSQFAMFPEPVNVQHFAVGSRPTVASEDERQQLGLTGCVFLYVGRLWRGKGLDYLLDAYERLRATGVDATLLLVGDGMDESRYRERARRLPGVVFAGFVQQPELPRWYGIADVLVFPTLGDPYGYVVEEAMASSLPVVATENAGEIRERVIDGVTGFVVPPSNSKALFERMARLATDRSLRTQMGRSGFERIQPRTVERWASDFERMIDLTLTKPVSKERR